jgi:hypothetical protein
MTHTYIPRSTTLIKRRSLLHYYIPFTLPAKQRAAIPLAHLGRTPDTSPLAYIHTYIHTYANTRCINQENGDIGAMVAYPIPV